MIEEQIALRAENGNETDARAKVIRFSDGARTFRGVAWIVGGIVTGVLSILIPILHLISVWGLPLIGIVMGRKALRTRAYVYEIEGECPACAQAISIYGGALQDDGWQRCPTCAATVQPVLLDQA